MPSDSSFQSIFVERLHKSEKCFSTNEFSTQFLAVIATISHCILLILSETNTSWIIDTLVSFVTFRMSPNFQVSRSRY